MSHKKRITQLEARHKPERKIYVTLYDESGRVSYGTSALLGKTADEVREIIGKDAIQLIVTHTDRKTNQENL